MITIKNLTKKYGDKIILNNLNYDIDDNEFIAIKGASGSGKTTLLNIIGLLDKDFEGEVLFNDKNIKKMSLKEKSAFIRNNISYLFQNYALIDNETIEQNLMLALEYTKLSKKEKKTLIKNALKMVGLKENVNQKIYKLSGGEQQRVALARTVLKPSKIILADEPTGNLDATNRDSVIHILKELKKQGKLIIVVTHDDYVAKACDKVMRL